MDFIGDEVIQIIDLRAEGKTMVQIGEAIGRNKNQILGKVFRLRQQGLITGPAPSMLGRDDGKPRSLASYVVACGGIRPSRHTKGLPIRYLRRTGLRASEMAIGAADNGYQTDGCEHILIDMLHDEAANVRHYSIEDLDIVLNMNEREGNE